MVLGQLIESQTNLPVTGVWIMYNFEGVLRHLMHVFTTSAEKVQADVKLQFVLKTVRNVGVETVDLVEPWRSVVLMTG